MSAAATRPTRRATRRSPTTLIFQGQPSPLAGFVGLMKP
jgi:hypothetical protein